MTALTTDRKTDQLGTPEVVEPALLYFPVEANTTLYGGALVAINANGNAVPASSNNTLRPVGRCARQVVNTTAAGFGTAGALSVTVEQGVFWFQNDGSISAANWGQYCYAIDDNNVSLNDGAGQRPVAGVVFGINTNNLYLPADAVSQVAVFVGATTPYQTLPSTSTAMAYRARAVVTSLSGGYAGSGTGVLTASAAAAFGTQDGVTVAAGDVVFLPAGTTNITAAKDAGPYVITTLGSGTIKWVLTRPDWWATGSTIPLGVNIEFDGEGTLYGGTTWRSFAATAQVVDTNDPVMYPRSVTQSVTLVASAKAITNVPIYSATRSNVLCSLSAVGGTTTNTVGYGTLAAATPGALNTATVTVNAIASGMTKNGTADTSVVLVTIING
jgi:hypothetical protein